MSTSISTIDLDGLLQRPVSDISMCGRGTGPVADRKVLGVVKATTTLEIMRQGDGNPTLRKDFADTYERWLKASTVAPVTGLEQFDVRYMVNGVTQAYDIFFYEQKGRRFRVPKGEYPYVALSVKDWAFLEDDELRPNDAVAISCPFYATGGVPHGFTELLDRCQELGVPVFVDAAYYGTVYGVSFDFSHPAIDAVSFSLSKPFCIQSYRVGLMLTKRKLGYLEEIQMAANYFNRVGSYVGMKLMNTFDADYLPLKYQARHREVCYALGLLPSHSIMLANLRDGDDRFDEVLRDDRFKPIQLPPYTPRRVCVSSYLSDTDSLPKKIIKRALGR